MPPNSRFLAHRRPCWSEPLFDEFLGHQPVRRKGQNQNQTENRNLGAAGGRASRGATTSSRGDGVASRPRWPRLPIQQRHPASTAPHLGSARSTPPKGRRRGIDAVRGDARPLPTDLPCGHPGPARDRARPRRAGATCGGASGSDRGDPDPRDAINARAPLRCRRARVPALHETTSRHVGSAKLCPE